MSRHEDVNETTEMWRQVHREQAARRETQRVARTAEILALGEHFQVRQLTEFQFRLDGALDLFPTNGRYHHPPTNTRGWYRNAKEIVMRMLRTQS